MMPQVAMRQRSPLSRRKKAGHCRTAYNYEYSLTDHLGDARVNFDMGTGVARQVQVGDYYPFGMDIPGAVVSSPKNNYLYNKKELQENWGLYDYGARFYDPVIARWTTVDPVQEFHMDVTPYAYVLNNPLAYMDLMGLDTIPMNSNAPIKVGDVVEISKGKYSQSVSQRRLLLTQKRRIKTHQIRFLINGINLITG